MQIPILPTGKTMLEIKTRNVIASRILELLRCTIIVIMLDDDFALISSLVSALHQVERLAIIGK